MRPLELAAISIISGITVSDALGWSYGLVVPGIILSLFLISIAYLSGEGFKGLASGPAFFFIGALFVIPWSRPDLPNDHILYRVRIGAPEASMTGSLIEGRILEAESSGRRTRVLLETGAFHGEDGWEAASGLVQLSINGSMGLMPGERIRTLAMLDEPRNFGNPGEFDYKGLLNRKGVFVTGFVKGERLVEKVEPAGPRLIPVDRMRAGIRAFIDSSGVENAEALKALIISGQGGMDRKLRDAFASTGTAHILSISGLHVGIVAAFTYGLIFFLMKRSERLLLALNTRKIALALSALPVVLYGALAGFPAPTQRAVIMVLAFTASFLLGRGRDYLNTLSLAAIIILVAAPYSVWDISFQLTFAAVAAIIVLVPRMKNLIGADEKDAPATKGERIRSFLERKLLPLVFVTVAAGIGTSPLLAYHFHRVSLVGLAANLAVVPLSALVVPLLLVSAALIPISEALALVPLQIADFTFGIITLVVRSFSSIPLSSLWVSPPSILQIAFTYSLAASIVLFREHRAARYVAAASALFIAASFGAGHFYRPHAGLLRVTFLSVGQGDSALIEFPDGKSMLVDGGGSNNPDFDIGERVVAPVLRAKGIEKLDYILLSHAQRDHMGGLAFIAANFEVGEFWWNGQGSLGGLKVALEGNGARISDTRGLGRKEVGGVALDFLHPPDGVQLDVNEMSVVMRMSYGRQSFLFTGDIGERAEALLMDRPVRAAVLKAPHHGSRGSSSRGFLEAVRPSIVVVSAGRRNAFGFPHQETLERYSAAGAKVMRTDLGGAAAFETDGKYLYSNAYLTDKGL